MTNRALPLGFNLPPAEPKTGADDFPKPEIAVLGTMATAMGRANISSPAPKVVSEAALANLDQFFKATFGNDDKHPPKPQN